MKLLDDGDQFPCCSWVQVVPVLWEWNAQLRYAAVFRDSSKESKLDASSAVSLASTFESRSLPDSWGTVGHHFGCTDVSNASQIEEEEVLHICRSMIGRDMWEMFQ